MHFREYLIYEDEHEEKAEKLLKAIILLRGAPCTSENVNVV